VQTATLRVPGAAVFHPVLKHRLAAAAPFTSAAIGGSQASRAFLTPLAARFRVDSATFKSFRKAAFLQSEEVC
jgi:hypothetical protein